MTATFVGMPPFPSAARAALADTQLRQNLAHATGTIRAKRAAVVAEVDEWEELRLAGAAIKDNTLHRLEPIPGMLPNGHPHRMTALTPANEIVVPPIAVRAGRS